jgi:hypothetical protein
MRGWFDLVSAASAKSNPPTCRAFPKKRLMGFEPTTFCMASRRSSQLSYSRTGADYRRAGAAGPAGRVGVRGESLGDELGSGLCY